MSFFNCKYNFFCPGISIAASVIVGIIAAVLQATGVITIGTVFSLSVIGVAVAYLAILLIAYAIADNAGECGGTTLSALLIGLLGSILFASLLLGAVAPATALGVIVVGVLFFFVSLSLTSLACVIKCFANGNK